MNYFSFLSVRWDLKNFPRSTDFRLIQSPLYTEFTIFHFFMTRYKKQISKLQFFDIRWAIYQLFLYKLLLNAISLAYLMLQSLLCHLSKSDVSSSGVFTIMLLLWQDDRWVSCVNRRGIVTFWWLEANKSSPKNENKMNK